MNLSRSVVLFVLSAVAVVAQRGGPPQGPPPTPKAGAPVDLTGYWVSLVTEDWRYRMLTPAKGDVFGIPLNPAGRAAAAAWDPAKDEAAGEQCKAFGVGGLLRLPGRIHITWQDDQTLKLDADAGSQSRTISFGPSSNQPAGAATWQGVSIASWDRGVSPMGSGLGPPPRGLGGGLKVVTTRMKAGYLRKNGVPYSANATLTEYVDRLDVPNGDSLLVIASELEDPANLQQTVFTSSHFKREPDGSNWHPTPCSAR